MALTLAFAACHSDQPSVVPPISRPTSSASSSPLASALPSPSNAPSASSAASPAPSASPSATASPAAPDTRFYGNLTTYAIPQPADTRTPGGGYRVVFSENIARHGSRSLTSSSDAQRALALWQRADDAAALTPRGKDFGPAVRKLTKAMVAVGYGELSTRGEHEQRGLGRREGARLDDYFHRVVADGDQIKIINTGVRRTETSASRFVEGLKQEQPRLKVRSQQTQSDLHFGSRDPDYQRYIDTNPQWRAAYTKAVAGLGLRSAAVRSLRLIYSAEFVDRLRDPTAEARAVWEIYRAQGAMSDDVRVDLTLYTNARTAAAFSFDQDALWFYSRGPGLTGSDVAYQAADPLLSDFFSTADKRLAGGSTAAVYRFAHDTELVPFAARLELAGSRQLTSRQSVYTWNDSGFRMAKVAPLAGNIGWTVWRNPDGQVLVQVRQNEVPSSLGGSCRPKIEEGLFYAWGEAKRCLGSG